MLPQCDHMSARCRAVFVESERDGRENGAARPRTFGLLSLVPLRSDPLLSLAYMVAGLGVPHSKIPTRLQCGGACGSGAVA